MLCEDAREEKSGKFTVVGLFPGNRILIDTPLVADDKKPAIPLAFLIIFRDGDGEAKLTIHTSDPDGNDMAAIVSPAQTITKLADRTLTLTVRTPAFAVPKLGTYVVNVMLDDKRYQFPFLIEAKAGQVH